ncbi:ADP-glyceromanno-heptose 6-epimerase [Desulfovibrio inopinatus]|uniref:ADP-glyceromanno-heptose 6-epimerase n=1 Tax=Desulfovibrio inopinatus TaxID=102109 RepID=UPI000420D6FA|nr:ADP-glyceromanno-heptose 6-epimerase [Desulfovibrio inopinatus]
MIIVTGGAGFIGSAVVWKLAQEGIEDILVVDNLGEAGPQGKWKNLVNLRYADYIHKAEFLRRLETNNDAFAATAVIHMGACSSTTETNAEYLMNNNFKYTKAVAQYCLKNDIRLINASSAATYGDGAMGFDDDPDALDQLRPLNMYGYSKQLFDLWAQRSGVLGRLASLKFFNVFGPNEYHKGDMKSVVCKAYHQIKETGALRLFKSYREDYSDGGQMRDFVYVKDCVDVMWKLMEHPDINGIFNVGSGRASTWNELAAAVFSAMDLDPHIVYIEMPESLQASYQYYTKANMERLASALGKYTPTPLHEAVADYVQMYLNSGDPYLG